MPIPSLDRHAQARRARVRSFVRRKGRLTPAQARALAKYWPTYGLSMDEALDLDHIFGRKAPRCLEIGFGMGDCLVAMALASPGQDYLGIDVYTPGIGHLLSRLAAEGLTNVRVLEGDVMDLLSGGFPDQSLDTVFVFFPDPWPKKRHHKRRLVQPEFLDLLSKKLKSGAHLGLATDWTPYAAHMLEALEAHPDYENVYGPGQPAPRPDKRPMTKFECRGERLGHEVTDLIYRYRP